MKTLAELSDFFQKTQIKHSLSEWGAPKGSMGRLVPSLLIKNIDEPVLWISDDKLSKSYPFFWTGLGVDLSKVFFLYEENPLKNLRQVFRSIKFKIIVIDSESFITSADMAFLSKLCKEKKLACLLIRKYFLSSKNGNPFCRYRLNSSFSLINNSLKLYMVKGPPTLPLTIKLKELFYE